MGNLKALVVLTLALVPLCTVNGCQEESRRVTTVAVPIKLDLKAYYHPHGAQEMEVVLENWGGSKLLVGERFAVEITLRSHDAIFPSQTYWSDEASFDRFVLLDPIPPDRRVSEHRVGGEQFRCKIAPVENLSIAGTTVHLTARIRVLKTDGPNGPYSEDILLETTALPIPGK